ncbi:hypothetical protein IAU59_005922 [Kwoniella sp. CBS 9459]
MPPRRSARVSAKEDEAAAAAPVAATGEGSTVAQDEGQVRSAAAKKPRGRPRKAAAVTAAVPAEVEGPGAEANLQQEAAPELTAESPKGTKKKRGRPTKAEVQAHSADGEPSTSAVPAAEGAGTVQEAGPSKAKKAKKEAKPAKEKPAKEEKPKAKGKGRIKKVDPNADRYASGCPDKFFKKFKKAISQRLFMVAREKGGNGHQQYEDFKILGSTGNVYTTRICSKPKCDCPDYLFNGRTICKHTIFVLIRVLKVPDESYLWYQPTLTASEIEQIFANAPPTPSEAIHAGAHKAYMKATGATVEEEEVAEEVKAQAEAAGINLKRLEVIGDDCPICYEEMTEEDVKEDRMVYDDTPTGCGKDLHKECFDMWAKTAGSVLVNKGQAVTCVWCRAPWPVPGGTNASPSKGQGKVRISGQNYHSMGYMNMAEVAGINQPRGVQ